jgi:hypothetical protein
LHCKRDKLFRSAPKMAFLPTEENQMQFFQAHFVARLQNYERDRSNVLTTLTAFFAAIEEGFDRARRYEALARRSDSELAALGLSREDLLHFVMLGKT